MKRMNLLLFVAVTAGFMLFGAEAALGNTDAGCTALGGDDTIVAGECQVSGAHSASGVITLDNNETLHILTGGSIVTGAAGISIEIINGDFLMDSGALIDGNVAGCNTGGPITVKLDDGDVDLETGSIIRSNSCSGGAIKITTTASHTANIDGTVESVGSISGVANQPPGGGTITIIAGCALTVSDTGKVSSRGQDPGADLVHLEGCTVTIFGLVESTGSGHVNPSNPANHCNLEPVAHPAGGAPSTFFTGCVEIWSGTTVTIDSTNGHKGEVNADIGFSGGTAGRGWIDIYANGNINIIDGTGNDRLAKVPPNGPATYFTSFAVHSNGGILQNTDDGGLITIKSLAGDVVASGSAIQADAISAGSNGGEVHVEANNDVSFDTAALFARGDFVATGGFGKGGKLGTVGAPIRAFTGAFSWTTGSGDVRPTGTLVPVAQRGQINLEACTALTLGAAFPVNGAAVPPFPATTGPGGAACVGGPPTKATAGALPVSNCIAQFCELPSSKSGTKFFDTNNNHQRDGGEPGLPNWEIRAFSGAVQVANAFTDASGNYTLNLAPGSYTVCEVQQGGYTQTCPQGPFPNGFGCAPGPAPITNAADCTALTGGGVGYAITLVSGEHETGNDFGNFKTGGNCEKQPVKDVLDPVSGRFPGNLGPDITVILSDGDKIQDAVDKLANLGDQNGDGFLIIAVQKDGTGQLGGNTNERVEISAQYPLPFALIGCSVTMHTPDAGFATGHITGAASAPQPKDKNGNTEPGNIFVMDLHGADSGVAGWLVDGNGRYLRNVDTGNNAVGVWFKANGNRMHNGSASFNLGDGMLIQGNGNLVDSTDVFGNTGNGITVVGNSNKLLKVDAGDKGKGNGGDGVKVTGNSNVLQEVDAYTNGLNGFEVSGTGNSLLKNVAGDRGAKANGGAGFLLSGGSSVVQNKAVGNLGDGFHLTTSGFSLKNNVSGGSGSGYPNGGCQYRFDVAGNTNAGGNTSNGVLLVGSPFAAGCD